MMNQDQEDSYNVFEDYAKEKPTQRQVAASWAAYRKEQELKLCGAVIGILLIILFFVSLIAWTEVKEAREEATIERFRADHPEEYKLLLEDLEASKKRRAAPNTRSERRR